MRLHSSSVAAVSKMRHKISADESAARRTKTDTPERRREVRTVRMRLCTFGMMHATERGVVTLEEGEGTVVDDSGTGMRLLLGIAPLEKQLLEIQTVQSFLKRSIYLVEVCWTKPVREDAQGRLFLVGGRLLFGPSHYWLS
ncbi:MAG TPA: hypothetical protein VI359_04250 [Nitrospiraceae bacterium]